MLQPKLLKVEPIYLYFLKLFYITGEIKRFDVTPYLTGSWFSRLQDHSYFSTVHISVGGYGIEWAEGQDIAPHELYELSTPFFP